MDIHRARFIPYPSSAINALSFSASSDSELSKGGLKNLRLAVGRANGDIEIWNPLKGAWVQERTFYAGKDRSIEGLAWTQEPSDFDGSTVSSTGQLRLFSIGYSNTVTEWDLGTGLPLRQSSGNLSEIWCFAVQPRMHPSEARKAAAEGKPRGQDIVVGCADGSIALLTTADNELHFSRFIARPTGKSVRALSIAWRDRYTVAVGFSNSSFKIFDIRGPKNIRTVTLGAGSKGGPKDLHVWALKWLPSGDIVTADSSGEVRFFESKLFSQYQRIKAHSGDIFSIAASQDGNRVFTAGSDMRTSIFQKMGKTRQWGRLGHKFFHGHDVKALAVYDGSKTQNMSFLASGGLDTNLSIVPVQNYGEEYHRVVSGLPQIPRITHSSSARLVASWHGQDLTVWRIKNNPNPASNKRCHLMLARITIDGEESISAATLSKDGQLLAVSSASATQLFRIIPNPRTTADRVIVQRVKPETPLPGGSLLQFSPDKRWLSIVSYKTDILLFRFNHDLSPLAQPFRPTRTRRGADTSSLQAYRRAITRQQFSPDSKMLVVSDLSGFVDCWSLEGEEDLTVMDVQMKDQDDGASENSSDDEDDEATTKMYGQYWKTMECSKTLPQLDSAALVLTFRPSWTPHNALPSASSHQQTNGVKNEDSSPSNDLYTLFILTTTHQLHEFSLPTGKFTDWSRRNPTSQLPERFRKIRDRAMGSFWHRKKDALRLYFYGSNWVYMLDVSRDLEGEEKRDGEEEAGLIEASRKRKWAETSGAGGVKRDQDFQGFRPGVEVTRDGVPVAKKPKIEEEQMIIKADEDEEDEGSEDDGYDGPSGRALRVKAEVEVEKGPWRSWHSFSYRPTLVVMPFQETPEYLETVLVERPGWELDLPPRLVGPYDSKKL